MRTYAALAAALALAVIFTVTGTGDAFAGVPLVMGAAGLSAPAIIASGALGLAAARDFSAFRRRMASGAAHYEKREAAAPDMRTIAETLEKIGTAFEAHKAANDERLRQLEGRGIDPVTLEKLNKIDAELNKLGDVKKSLELLQTRAARLGAGARGEQEDAPEAIAHRKALLNWMRDPRNAERHAELRQAQKDIVKKQGEDGWEARAAQVVTSTGSAGGFALPEQIERQIASLGRDVSPMRQISTVRLVGTPDYKELFDVNGAAFEWLGEAATRNQTNTSDLAEVAPTFGLASAKPQASEESLDDLFFDVEAWLVETAALAIAQGEGAAYVGGNGTNRPTGFLAGPAPLSTADGSRAFGTLQYIAGGQAAAVPTNLDPFTNMVYALRARYRANARWVTAKAFLSTLRNYKDTTNQPLWQQSVVLGQPDTFMGYPVTEAEDMPVVAANAFPIAFGDFREGYLIADRVGLRITRDEITTPGFVKFYVRKRTGGKLRNTEAIKLLKISTT